MFPDDATVRGCAHEHAHRGSRSQFDAAFSSIRVRSRLHGNMTTRTGSSGTRFGANADRIG